MTIQNKVSRRNFIKVSGITGAALTLGLYTPSQGEELKLLKTDTAKNLGVELNAWISIDTTGKVTIMNHRAEMGQGAYQIGATDDRRRTGSRSGSGQYCFWHR